ncbi:hypothetical protein [Aquabacterium sp.]|uniref:hypothetical protein n=1 Tax=Aquabacterium sp. TaxID=1872578 RepID=UPI0040379417
MSQHDTLTQALRALLDRYTMLVNSGDAGNWDPEEEPEVIAARAVLSATQPAQAAQFEPFAGQSNIESPFNACMHKGYCVGLKAQAAQSEPMSADQALDLITKATGWQSPPPSFFHVVRATEAHYGIGLKSAARFAQVHCSQCGGSFGPGNAGFSHCDDHGITQQERPAVAQVAGGVVPGWCKGCSPDNCQGCGPAQPVQEKAPRSCVGDPGECEHNGACMYACRRMTDTGESLCEDEGCDHHGMPHVCVNNSKHQAQGAGEVVQYVPAQIRSTAYEEKTGRHPNDKEPQDDACTAALNQRGDNKGQGLDTYWKWGFRSGWNAAVSARPHPTPAQPAPVVPDGWRDAYAAFVGAFDTPQLRRLMPDAFSQDARKRLMDFNDAMLAATPTPPAQAAADARDAFEPMPERAKQQYEFIRDRLNTPGMYGNRVGAFVSWFDAALATHQQGGSK